MTRGHTWYQAFLHLDDKLVLRTLRSALTKRISGTVQSLSRGYTVNSDKIISTLKNCTTECTWLDFHIKLFRMYPELKKDGIFNNIIDYHVYERFHTELRDMTFTGKFEDVPCIQIRLQKLPIYIPFSEQKHQIGGGRNKHVFQSGEEDTE